MTSKTIKTVYDADPTLGNDLTETYYFPSEDSSGNAVGLNAQQLNNILAGYSRIFPIISLSDESTDLVVGTDAINIEYFPYDCTINSIGIAMVNTAPVGADIIVDINVAGSSIFSTNKLTIDAGSSSSVGSSTTPTLVTTTITAGQSLSFDIDQIGTTTKGKGLKISMDITRT